MIFFIGHAIQAIVITALSAPAIRNFLTRGTVFRQRSWTFRPLGMTFATLRTIYGLFLLQN